MIRRKSTLFELERQLRGKPHSVKRTFAKAYDSGVSIELSYNASFWQPPQTAPSEDRGYAQSLDWAGEIQAYTVEAFEVEEENQDESSDESRNSVGETEQNRYVLKSEEDDAETEETPTEELPEPKDEASDDNEAREADSNLTAAAAALEQDLLAIQSSREQHDRRESVRTPNVQRKEIEDTHPHAVFDRMGRNMAFATTFDLGTLEMEKRFDEFDKELAISEKPACPQQSLESFKGPVQLTDLDLAEDFAIMNETAEDLASQTLALTYDRAGAVAYARKFWNVPCDDLFIALSASGKEFAKVPDGTKFVHDPGVGEHALKPDGSRIEWADLDDCTHFISCCIGERPGQKTGGLPIPYKQLGEPPSDPYGIVRVSTMVDFLIGKLNKKIKYASLLAEKSEDESLITKLQPGDLIAYFHKAEKQYTHMAIYLGDGKIACHTYSRSDDAACTWDNSWNIGVGTHQWTFIQFIV